MKLSRLKRFSKDKHEQLEQLLSWCELAGITGKDLISLGGHIDRMQKTEQRDRNLEIVRGYQLDKIGDDSNIYERDRFSIKSVNGRYRFDGEGYDWVKVTSYTSKKAMRFPLPHYDVGRIHWRKAWVSRAVLAVHEGKIVLNW